MEKKYSVDVSLLFEEVDEVAKQEVEQRAQMSDLPLYKKRFNFPDSKFYLEKNILNLKVQLKWTDGDDTKVVEENNTGVKSYCPVGDDFLLTRTNHDGFWRGHSGMRISRGEVWVYSKYGRVDEFDQNRVLHLGKMGNFEYLKDYLNVLRNKQRNTESYDREMTKFSELSLPYQKLLIFLFGGVKLSKKRSPYLSILSLDVLEYVIIPFLSEEDVFLSSLPFLMYMEIEQKIRYLTVFNPTRLFNKYESILTKEFSQLLSNSGSKTCCLLDIYEAVEYFRQLLQIGEHWESVVELFIRVGLLIENEEKKDLSISPKILHELSSNNNKNNSEDLISNFHVMKGITDLIIAFQKTEGKRLGYEVFGDLLYISQETVIQRYSLRILYIEENVIDFFFSFLTLMKSVDANHRFLWIHHQNFEKYFLNVKTLSSDVSPNRDRRGEKKKMMRECFGSQKWLEITSFYYRNFWNRKRKKELLLVMKDLSIWYITEQQQQSTLDVYPLFRTLVSLTSSFIIDHKCDDGFSLKGDDFAVLYSILHEIGSRCPEAVDLYISKVIEQKLIMKKEDEEKEKKKAVSPYLLWNYEGFKNSVLTAGRTLGILRWSKIVVKSVIASSDPEQLMNLVESIFFGERFDGVNIFGYFDHLLKSSSLSIIQKNDGGCDDAEDEDDEKDSSSMVLVIWETMNLVFSSLSLSNNNKEISKLLYDIVYRNSNFLEDCLEMILWSLVIFSQPADYNNNKNEKRRKKVMTILKLYLDVIELCLRSFSGDQLSQFLRFEVPNKQSTIWKQFDQSLFFSSKSATIFDYNSFFFMVLKKIWGSFFLQSIESIEIFDNLVSLIIEQQNEEDHLGRFRRWKHCLQMMKYVATSYHQFINSRSENESRPSNFAIESINSEVTEDNIFSSVTSHYILTLYRYYNSKGWVRGPELLLYFEEYQKAMIKDEGREEPTLKTIIATTQSQEEPEEDFESMFFLQSLNTHETETQELSKDGVFLGALEAFSCLFLQTKKYSDSVFGEVQKYVFFKFSVTLFLSYVPNVVERRKSGNLEETIVDRFDHVISSLLKYISHEEEKEECVFVMDHQIIHFFSVLLYLIFHLKYDQKDRIKSELLKNSRGILRLLVGHFEYLKKNIAERMNTVRPASNNTVTYNLLFLIRQLIKLLGLFHEEKEEKEDGDDVICKLVLLLKHTYFSSRYWGCMNEASVDVLRKTDNQNLVEERLRIFCQISSSKILMSHQSFVSLRTFSELVEHYIDLSHKSMKEEGLFSRRKRRGRREDTFEIDFEDEVEKEEDQGKTVYFDDAFGDIFHRVFSQKKKKEEEEEVSKKEFRKEDFEDTGYYLLMNSSKSQFEKVLLEKSKTEEEEDSSSSTTICPTTCDCRLVKLLSILKKRIVDSWFDCGYDDVRRNDGDKTYENEMKKYWDGIEKKVVGGLGEEYEEHGIYQRFFGSDLLSSSRNNEEEDFFSTTKSTTIEDSNSRPLFAVSPTSSLLASLSFQTQEQQQPDNGNNFTFQSFEDNWNLRSKEPFVFEEDSSVEETEFNQIENMYSGASDNQSHDRPVVVPWSIEKEENEEKPEEEEIGVNEEDEEGSQEEPQQQENIFEGINFSFLEEGSNDNDNGGENNESEKKGEEKDDIFHF